MSEPCMHNGACDGLYTVRESLQSSLHSNDARVEYRSEPEFNY